MNQEEIYLPSYALSLKDMPQSQIRLGVQGYPGSGKTWSALTAPNPIIANFDNKLKAHEGKDIPVIPFHSASFVNDVMKIPNTSEGKIDLKLPPNRHDAFLRWIKEEGIKLKPHQTLIVDSWSSLMNSLELYWNYNPGYTSAGKVNDWAPYNAKISYAQEVCMLFSAVPAHIVMTCHETDQRDKKTKELTGKIRPLMSGQFADQLPGQFTDWYRMHHVPSKKSNGENVVLNEGTPYRYEVKSPNGEWFWQTVGDDLCDCCCSMPDVPMYVKADFQKVFLKKEFI